MIRVFKTNVEKKKDALLLLKSLRALLPQARSNFDLLDCDKILRVEMNECDAARIVGIINEHGFSCVELE